jgi:hypothetical protein
MTRAKRTRLALAAGPITAYVLLMALVAALWVKPPLQGWIGFAIIAFFGGALVAAAFVLFPRSRTNMPALEGTGRRNGVLVLADATCSCSQLRESIAGHLDGRDAEVHVVAPVLPDALHNIADDEEADVAAAERRLADTLERLRAAGIAATGSVGTEDPLQALGDALPEFPASELVIVTSTESQWLEDGVLERARPFAPSVEQIVVAPVVT